MTSGDSSGDRLNLAPNLNFESTNEQAPPTGGTPALPTAPHYHPIDEDPIDEDPIGEDRSDSGAIPLPELVSASMVLTKCPL